LGFVIAPFAVWGAVALFRNYASKAKAQPAVLRKKEIVEHEKFGGSTVKKHVLCFDVDGKKRRFYVSPEQYAVARAGKRGTLTHRGSRFISFE